MNILFLYPVMRIGGAQQVILGLSNSLNKNGHNISIICQEGELIDSFEDGIKIYNAPLNKKDIKSVLESIRIIKKVVIINKINIINSHHRYTTFLANIMKCILKSVHVIHTEHSVYPNKNFINLRGRNIIAVSNIVKNNMVKNGVNSEYIKCIYNGVNFEERILEDINNIDVCNNNGVFKIAVIARLSKEKGHIYLLEAVKEIIRMEYNINLTLFGDGPEREYLEEYVYNNNLNNNIIFRGNTKNINGVIKNYDLFVLPSIQEGLPMSILEVMAQGKIMLCTDVGGNREIIDHKQNGFIVKSRSSEELIEYIKYIYDNISDLQSIKIEAMKKIRKNFTIERTIQEYLNYFNTIMNSGI